MTWTYSGNPGNSDLDQVRFIIGDTDERDPQLTDEEIQFLLSEGTSPLRASIAACSALIAKYTRQVNYYLGPERSFASQRAQQYRALRADLQRKLSLKNADFSWDSSIQGKNVFDIGMHDAPGGSGWSGLDGS